MPENEAAWLPSKAAALAVGPAPYTPPKAHQVVIRNAAVAINPIDWIKQAAGNLVMGFMRYPFVLGSDVAGTVEAVGADVTHVRPGDRVLALALGLSPESNDPAEGAFQRYSVVAAQYAVALPPWLSFAEAAVLPLGLATAGHGLFHGDCLGLPLRPTVPARPPADRALLVSGASSSVGSCAVQLARAAGYAVVATASPRNFDYVRALGAYAVFDYRSPAVVADVVGALQGKAVAGAYAVGDGAVPLCMRVLAQLPGSRKRVANASSAMVTGPGLASWPGRLATGATMLAAAAREALLGCRLGVTARFINIEERCRPNNTVARVVYQGFLADALAARQLVAAPPPLVVGHGLGAIQEAFEVQKKGVSAQKVVVTL